METNDQIELHPEIIVEWEIWDQTWVLNRAMKYSERYGVNVSVDLQPGSMTLIFDILSPIADIIEVTLFIAALLAYIYRRMEKKDLPPPKINADAAFAEAVRRLEMFEGIKNSKVKSIRRIERGYELIFTDPLGNVYRFEIYNDGSYEYFRIL